MDRDFLIISCECPPATARSARESHWKIQKAAPLGEAAHDLSSTVWSGISARVVATRSLQKEIQLEKLAIPFTTQTQALCILGVFSLFRIAAPNYRSVPHTI